MKKYLITAVLALAMMPTYAEVIGTGGAGGSYDKYGKTLASHVKGLEAKTSNGGRANLIALASGKIDFAQVQMDDYADWLTDAPDVATSIVGKMYLECGFLFINNDGTVTDEDDLQTKGVDHVIAIGEEGSGTVATWDYMQVLEPKYARTSVKNTGGILALGALENADSIARTIDAVLVTMRPNVDNDILKFVRDSKHLSLVPLNDMDLNDNHPVFKKPVYEFVKVPLNPDGFFRSNVKTICTNAIIVTRDDVDASMVKKVGKIMLTRRASLLK